MNFILFIGYFLYLIIFIIIYFIYKKIFINKVYYNKNYYNYNVIYEQKIRKINDNYLLNKKNLFLYKFFLFNKYIDLNSVNIFFSKKNLWLKKIFTSKKNFTNIGYDQFDYNLPIYKKNLFITFFINKKKLDNFFCKYKNFFSLKNMPFNTFFKDYLICYKFKYKKERNIFEFKKLEDNFSFNIFFIYWIFLIPFFFIQYIFIKYHLKLYIKTKRRTFYYIRSFLDNFRLFVKLNKYLGRSFFKDLYKSKRWKDPSHAFLNKKRAKRCHFGIHNIRYRKLYYRISPIGSYYFWFSKINIIKYLFSYKNFFFKSFITSYYFFWIMLIYFIIIITFFNKLKNYKLIKNFKFLTFFKKSN